MTRLAMRLGSAKYVCRARHVVLPQNRSTGSEVGDFFAELAEFALQVRQAIEDGYGFPPGEIVHGGIAGIDCRGGDIAGHAGL
jgi:hypothetical protein